MPMIRRKPRLIPVLDILNGQVVHAIAGRRHEYRPLESKLVQSTDPQTVAEALLYATGAEDLYIADLNAIQGNAQPSEKLEKLLESTMEPVWLDGGFGSKRRLSSLPRLPHSHLCPIVAFETCGTPESLAFSPEEPGDVGRFSPSRHKCVGFSIDLRAGELIGDWQAWRLRDSRDALGLAREVIRRGYQHLIVLDLARVGMGNGCGTQDLLRAIRTEFPEIELIAGGGVKSWEDIDHLGECGVDAVLVASSLHDLRITFPRPVSP